MQAIAETLFAVGSACDPLSFPAKWMDRCKCSAVMGDLQKYSVCIVRTCCDRIIL